MCPRVKPRQKDNSNKPAKLWVLLVGVNQYQDSQNLASLQYSALDCQGLGEALKDATASRNKEVIIHHDFAQRLPRLIEVQQSISQITAAAGSEDTILFYFSGHGILDAKTQQVVLCFNDTDTTQLTTTGLPLKYLLKQLSNCAASQQLVWLDACHSGGMTLRGTDLSDPSSQLVEVLRNKAAESKGFYALLSCDRAQQSWEFPELGHGVFTYYLMRGLRGEAADAKGDIEADALYQYVFHQTLRYIDKTNQQIRLINQQKSSRGEGQLQSEFPLQTPKRIVEGFGTVVLGTRSHCNLEVNPRQALVIDGSTANRTTLALSQILQSRGDFNLRYFPQTNEPWSRVFDAIASLGSLNEAVSTQIATTLLYIRAKVEISDTGESLLVLPDGIRLSRSWLRNIFKKSRAVQQIIILDCPGEHSLADWVEDLQLETERGQCSIAANSPTDNCQQFAQALLETLQNADSGAELPVAAWIVRLQMTLAGTKVLPHVWLSGTQGVIDILVARNQVSQKRSYDLGICPYMGLEAFNEASAEYFYGREALVQKLLNHINHKSSLAVVGASGSGKSSVVQAGLIASLRQGKQIPNSDRWWLGCFRPGNKPIQALAKLLVDASSSDRIKEQLQIEALLYQGVEGFVRWLRSRIEPVVVLVIDQFEELFTLAAEGDRTQLIELILGAVKYAGDRFKLVLTIRADFTASCLEIPALAQLLQQNSVLVPPYLTEEDYRQAIVKPARQVGLKVESGLVEVLLQDLDRSAGDLPLLQFALQQLWLRRENGKLTLNAYQDLGKIQGALERQAQKVYDSLDPQTQDCARWIFLNLTQLGEGTEDTRRRITKSDLVVAKYPEALIDKTLRILTEAKLLVVNLDSGNNTAQSRSAADPPQDDELFLEAMRQEATVEVVHEILIRHWSTLRWWLEENRSRLRSQRQIEQAAVLWQQNNCQDDFLLHGIRLGEAEEVYVKYTDELSDTATEFVAACIDARVAREKAVKKRLRQTQLTATALGILGLAATAFGISTYRQQLITQIENINSLTAVAEAQLLSNQQLESLTSSIQAGQQLKQINGLGKVLVGLDNWQQTKVKTAAGLQQSIYGTQELNRLEGHARQVEAVSVSDDGEMFATASNDLVKIWHGDGRLIKNIAKDSAEVNPIIVNIDGSQKQIVNPIYAKQDTTDRAYLVEDEVVQLRSLEGITDYPHQHPVNSFSLSPDEKLLATATRDGIYIWTSDGILRQTINGHTGEVLNVKFIPDGTTEGDRYKLISSGVDKTVRVWQILDRYSNETRRIDSVAVSPVSNTYAVADWSSKIDSDKIGSGKIQLWRDNNGTQQLIRTLPKHQNTILQIKYSPDGKLIASAGWDENSIKLWDAENGKLKETLKHTEGVNSIAFSKDGQFLISGSEDNTIKIWDIANQPQLIKTLTGHTDSIKAVAVSADGKIASAGYDNTIKLWTNSGELLQTINAHDLAITSLAFTSDSNTLASASWDNTIKLWSLSDEGKTNKLLHTLKHQDGVTAIDFNWGGTVLASGSGDRQIKLWDTATGRLIKSLKGHTSKINSLAFSNNDKFIISGEEQQGLFRWNLDLDNLLVKGCDRLSDYLATNPNLETNKPNLCR